MKPKPPRVAWVPRDEDDNEPALFWTYALTALDAVQPGLCTQLLTYLQTQQAPKPPLRNVLQALINTLASRSEQFLLRSEEHTSELQSQSNLVCRLLLETKKSIHAYTT